MKEKDIPKKGESLIVQLGRIGLISVHVSICQTVWIRVDYARVRILLTRACVHE